MRTVHRTRYLDTVGDGSGTKNANGNYSGAAEEFLLIPTKTMHVGRILISYEDTTSMQAQEYGNFGVALTNGIEVETRDDNDSVFSDLTDGIPIKTNAQWAQLCYDVDVKSWGAGNELLVVRWTFERYGTTTPVTLEPGHKLVVKLNDDFTGLITQYFIAEGVE